MSSTTATYLVTVIFTREFYVVHALAKAAKPDLKCNHVVFVAINPACFQFLLVVMLGKMHVVDKARW